MPLDPEPLIIALARLTGYVGQLSDSIADLHEIVDKEKVRIAMVEDVNSHILEPGISTKILESAAIYTQLDDVIREARLVLRMAEDMKDSLKVESKVSKDAS